MLNTNEKITRNLEGVLRNRFQGDALKVLTVCSAGCLRSPTAATILASEPFNFNTRSCGIDIDWAIVPISVRLIVWADIILVMDNWMKAQVENYIAEIVNSHEGWLNEVLDTTVISLDIPDNFSFMQSELQEIMIPKFKEIFGD